MKRIGKWVFQTPAIQLNTLVIIEIVSLLFVSLAVLFYFARKTLVDETKMDAELQLDGTMQHVDNILLGIEESAGNIYYDLLEHLDEPEQMASYCRRVIQCNSNVDGCAIAFKPGYYPDTDSLFRVYVRRDELKGAVSSPKFGHIHYTEQPWYANTMMSGKARWLYPFVEQEDERIVSFCLPIIDKNKECVGVMAVDLSVELLSQVVLAAKPTPNSYCILLNSRGMYVIHPNKSQLLSLSALTLADQHNSPSKRKVIENMMNGETGNSSYQLDGETWYIFYKPFVRHNVPGRSLEDLKWSIGIVYPKTDIFNEYNHHVTHIILIAVFGLLFFYIFSRIAIRRQLSPLRRLTESANSIAEGNYATTISDTDRNDEVGMFQNHFKLMQEALLKDISKQEELSSTLNERREELRKIHDQLQEDDQVKTTFLHNVTNRLIPPTESILGSVTLLSENYQHMSQQEADKEVANIQEKSEYIMDLLKKKFETSYTSEVGKEENHE